MTIGCGVNHIFSGKTVTREVRAHFFVEAVLTNVLYAVAMNESVLELISNETGQCTNDCPALLAQLCPTNLEHYLIFR